MKFASLAFCSLLLWTPFGVRANTEEFVTSIHHGGNPFMVVSADVDGGSRRPPGVYGRSQESWRQILNGEMLRDERKGYWLKQLALSKKDELYHTLTVVNRKLYLINLISDVSQPGTLLEIGTKNSPLLEAITGQRRVLPEITSVNNISFYAVENGLDSIDYQTIVLSVRCESCGGDGITFAIGVRQMTNERRGYELVGQARVIDYRFYAQNELPDLVEFDRDKKTYNLRSGVATDFLNSTDLSIFKHHEPLVTKKVHELMAKGTGRVPAISVDLKTGQMGQALAPSIGFQGLLASGMGQPFTFMQHYSLRNQSMHLNIVSEAAELSHAMTLNFKAPGEPAIFGQHDTTSSIFVADDKLFLVHKTGGRLALVELGVGPVEFDHYEIYDKVVEQGADPAAGSVPVQKKTLILSTVSGDRGKVEAYKLAFYSTGAIIVEDRVKLMNQGLADFELTARAKVVNGSLLFDSLTPPVASVDQYEQVASLEKPLINVSESNGGKLTYAFAEPMYQVASKGTGSGTGYVYQVYAESNLLPNPTGIYTAESGAGKKPSKAMGELLKRDYDPEFNGELDEIPLLGEKPRVAIEGIGKISLDLMAMDTTFNRGNDNFKMVVAVKSDDRQFQTQFVEFQLPFPFHNLATVRTFPGRKSHDQEIVFVYSYEKELNGQKAGFTSAVTLRASLNQGRAEFKFDKEVQISTDVLDQTQMRARVIYDEDGRLNFVRDPRIARDDRRLEVYNFTLRQVVRPNADRSVKLIWDSKEEHDGESYDERKVAWQLSPNDVDKRFTFIPKRTRDAEATYMWGNIFTLLDKMAQQRESSKVQVLIVPEDMKKYVNELVMTRYGRRIKERDATPFHFTNRSLRVYQVDYDGSTTQDDVMDNLDSIQKQKRDSNLIIGDMNDIIRLDRPASKATNFHIRTHIIDDSAPDFGEETRTEEYEELPHMLYLLAAGDSLQPDELAAKPVRNYSTLLISTPEEWKVAKDQADMEWSTGLEDRYEVTKFPLPNPEDRAQLLGQLFQDRNVALMRFQFSAVGISKPPPVSQDAHLSKLMEYAVMRVASEAENSRMDGLNAFVNFRNQFAQQLLREDTVRRTKMVDKAFVERVLTSVFDIPVNLDSLPPDDPIMILSRKDAVRKLQDRGVAGPFAIKARFIKTMLSVLKDDPTRNIPSSHIIIGESGSGKTKMVTGLLDWLYPNVYDFNNSTRNADANSLRINVGKLIGGVKDGVGGDQRTFHEIKTHINNFLVNGYRGAIFFDDFHAAPESVRTELLGFVRTLLETQGLYHAQDIHGDVYPVPLRHLHLIIALNPTENQALIDSFRKEKDKPATFEEVLLASLSTKDLKIERSLIKRVGAIHNMLKFPHGAKAPALSNDVMKVSRDIMLRKQKLIMNSASAIRTVADAFPAMDARTFLSTASSSLVDQVDPQLFPTGTLFHVIPGRRRLSGSSFISTESIDASEKGQIEEYVLRNTKVLPLTDTSAESQLHFINTLTHNFRLPLYEQFLISLEDDERFSESIDNQRNFLLPSMMGIRRHLNEHPDVPLSELNMDPHEFGLTSAGDRELFREIVREVSPNGLKYFPFPISRLEQAEGWNILLTGEAAAVNKSRATMITRYYLHVLASVQQYTKKYFHLENLDGMPRPITWLKALPSTSNENAMRPNVDELRNLYWKFFSEINDPSLRNPGEPADAHLTPYAISRIFYYLIDKAITEMPWIQLNKHIVRSLDQVVQDQVLGQSPAIKSYFFEYKYSPIRASNPELIQQLVESSQLAAEYPPERQISIHENYVGNCEQLLGGKK